MRFKDYVHQMALPLDILRLRVRKTGDLLFASRYGVERFRETAFESASL
jgi:hypothetical protein